MRAVIGCLLVLQVSALARDVVMVGKEARRGGFLVADLTPLQGDNATMARQQLCPNACNGHGVCVIQQDSSFPPECTCFFMWAGLDCGIAKCPNDCSGSGTCDHSVGVCHCNEGLGAEDCSLNLRASICPNDCSGNGVCKNTVCECATGWESVDCSTSLCPSNCTNHGVCVPNPPEFAGGSCACEPGYFGDDCSQILHQCPTRQGVPEHVRCSGHGFCDRNTGACECDAPWTGDDCSVNECIAGYLNSGANRPPPYAGCPNDCSCHGYCVCADVDEGEPDSCHCACEPAWAGDACSIPIPIGDLYEGSIQPQPDPEIYPEIHPWLTDEERTAIAMRNADPADDEPVQNADNADE